jgi:hypothetical protein
MRVSEQMQALNLRHQQDSEHIAQLASQVANFSSVLQALAEQQMNYQAEMRKMIQGPNTRPLPGHVREHSGASRQAPSFKAPVVEHRESPKPIVSEIDREIGVIQDLLAQGKFDEASIKVRQASRRFNVLLKCGTLLIPSLVASFQQSRRTFRSSLCPSQSDHAPGSYAIGLLVCDCCC